MFLLRKLKRSKVLSAVRHETKVQRTHIRPGRRGSLAKRNCTHRNAAALTALTTNKAITTDEFHANVDPPPERGT